MGRLGAVGQAGTCEGLKRIGSRLHVQVVHEGMAGQAAAGGRMAQNMGRQWMMRDRQVMGGNHR